MKKRSNFKVNSFLRIVKKGQIIKIGYPDVNLRKLKSRIDRLEYEKAVDISRAYYTKAQIERGNLNSYLALILSIISLVFSIWK